MEDYQQEDEQMTVQISEIMPVPVKRIKPVAMKLWEEAALYESAGVLAKAKMRRMLLSSGTSV